MEFDRSLGDDWYGALVDYLEDTRYNEDIFV